MFLPYCSDFKVIFSEHDTLPATLTILITVITKEYTFTEAENLVHIYILEILRF